MNKILTPLLILSHAPKWHYYFPKQVIRVKLRIISEYSDVMRRFKRHLRLKPSKDLPKYKNVEPFKKYRLEPNKNCMDIMDREKGINCL